MKPTTLVPDGSSSRARTAADAFEALAPAVLGYLRAGGSDDPENLLGDVFLAVASGIDDFDGDADALRRWIFTIAHHRLVDERRRSARRRDRRNERTASPLVVPAPPEPFDRDLLGALHALTADQRDVLALRFVADLSLETVAALTHRRVGAVKALQARGLRNLAAALPPR